METTINNMKPFCLNVSPDSKSLLSKPAFVLWKHPKCSLSMSVIKVLKGWSCCISLDFNGKIRANKLRLDH